MPGVEVGPGQLLADVQVISLGAGQTLQSISGATNTVGGGTVQMTPNSVNTTSPKSGQYWDGLLLVAFPGTLAPGATAPDLKLQIHVDGVDYTASMYLDISIDGCMLPRPQNSVGKKFVRLGESMYVAALAAQRNGAPPGSLRNMATRFTGLKITDEITFYFTSNSGFTSSTFDEPPTVQLYGDVYDAASLRWVQQVLGWNPTISETSVRRASKGLPPYQQAHQSLGPGASAWNTLPGGPQQGGVKVYRFLKFSTNAQPVSGNQPYGLTKVTALNGGTNNIPPNEDLGFKFAGTGNAIKLLELGHRPAPGAGYIGLYFGGSEIYPGDTSLGTPSTYGNPRIPFGAVQPWRPESNLWYALPSWGSWAGEPSPELVAGEDAAIAIAAQNGQTIAAGADEVALGGVLIVVGSLSAF